MAPESKLNRWWLCALFLFALFLRLFQVDWDQHHFFHPDERAIGFAVDRLSFSPLQLNPHFFAYGSLPLYVIKGATALLGNFRASLRGYDASIYAGRILSALWGAATAVLIAFLGARLYGQRTGLLAGFLTAAAVLHVQNSHFATSDVPLSCLTVLALYFLIGVIENGRLSDYIGAGLAAGLALATKFSGLPILLPIAISAVYRARIERRLRPLGFGLIAGLALFLGFFIGQPYAILDFPAFRSDILEQSRMVRHAGGVPYTNQYIGVPKFLYELKEMVLWGMGPPLGLAAVIGTGVCLVQAIRRRRVSEIVLLSWVVPFFLISGSFDVKFPRYLLPIYPLLILWGAWGLVSWASRRRTGKWILALVLITTLMWLVAFLRIYRHPHTVVTASEWFYQNVPRGTKVASQHWDEGFPFPLPGERNPDRFRVVDLPYYEPDTPQKISQICRELSSAEYAVFQTKRIYGSVTRAPKKFPLTNRYFYRLFAGDLGFRLTQDFVSRPAILGIEFPDELADESFSVYDHPKVLIFRNTEHLSEDTIETRVREGSPSLPLTRRDLLVATAARFEKAMAMWRNEPVREVTTAPASTAPAPISEEPQRASPARLIRERSVHSFGAAVIWFAALLLIAMVSFPITFVLFPRLGDRGAGLARMLGLVLVTYVYSLGVRLRLLPNSGLGAWIVLIALGAGGAVLLRRKRRAIREFWETRSRRVLAGELAFLVGFLFFLAFRAFNPEIYWGEKPMDFSILNILVRTPTLPPSDPWFAGAPLGYYTFGQEMIAFLSLLCSLSTRYTFNLAFGLLGGAIVQGAFTLGREWGGRVRAGVAAAGLLAFAGNLSGLRFWRGQHLPLNWHYFWATSRVIRDTINEYPFWSLLFADLHAHVLAIPVFLLVAALAVELARAHADAASRPRERLVLAVAFGFTAAIQVLTNAWDAPFLLGLLVLVGLIAFLAPRRRGLGSLAWAAVTVVVAGAAAFLTARPLWVRGGGVPNRGWNGPSEPGASGVDVATMFGLFFFLAAAWWVTAARAKLKDRGFGGLSRFAISLLAFAFLAVTAFAKIDLFLVAGILLFLLAAILLAEKSDDRLACGLIATGFFLVLFPQHVFIYDRMNTFFKIYLEAWLVFSLGTAVLVFGSRVGNFSRWSVLARTAFAILLFGAFFTTVTAARGSIESARPTYLQGPHTPTLDGMRYLDTTQPGEARAVAWVRRSIGGTPVILEAQGPSYQKFGRVSMLTGLPTVLGWDYHVQQRGNRSEEIASRRDAVKQVYSSADAASIEPLLRRYHVGYVYVGWLERATYPLGGLAKFPRSPNLFTVAYENPEAKVYRVVGGDAQDVVTLHEASLPPARELGSTPTVEPSEAEEKPVIREKPEPGRPSWAGMREPRDATVDERGRVWIADFGNSRVRIFDASGGSLGGWGGRGKGRHGFNQLCGVAAVGNDLYVADTWNGRIERFGQDGAWKGAVNELYGPRGVAVASDGSVWITDTGNHRIIAYDAELRNPHVYGKKGTGPGEFDEPVGIAVGPSGLVYVADTGNGRIQAFDAKGSFRGQWPIPTWVRGSEAHIEVDSDESLFAAEPGRDSVLHLDTKTGAILDRWFTDAERRKLVKPIGLALDRKKRILYVVNTGENSVSTLTVPEREKRK